MNPIVNVVFACQINDYWTRGGITEPLSCARRALKAPCLPYRGGAESDT
jgi:hypothetical protein